MLVAHHDREWLSGNGGVKGLTVVFGDSGWAGLCEESDTQIDRSRRALQVTQREDYPWRSHALQPRNRRCCR